MSNYFTGLISSSFIYIAILLSMGFQHGGTQHFNDIVVNSITLVDKNGLGGSFNLLDEKGEKILSIKDGRIRIFDQSGQEVVAIQSDKQGRGNIALKNGGYLETFNDYDNKTVSIGENINGFGSISTYNNSLKQTSVIGANNDGIGKLTIFDNNGREALTLLRSLTTFNREGKITGKYGTNNSGDGSVILYDRFGNRGWYKTGKNS